MNLKYQRPAPGRVPSMGRESDWRVTYRNFAASQDASAAVHLNLGIRRGGRKADDLLAATRTSATRKEFVSFLLATQVTTADVAREAGKS